MRIVFVSDAIYPYSKGGKEKRLYEISTRLSSRGHDVHIYTMHWWQGVEKERTENGVHLHAICRYHEMYSGNKRSVKEGVLFGLSCLKLISEKFDVLDVDHMPFFPVFSTWLVCLLCRKKLYGTWHEALTLTDWKNYMGMTGYIAALIERMSIKLPYIITSTCEHTKQVLQSYHHRKKRVMVVACGIDSEMIRNTIPIDARCDVLYVGRLVKDKNVAQLIRTFALVVREYPAAKCIIIGHGIEKENLHHLVRELALEQNVTIMKPLAESCDVYAYMKRAKVFVLPSVREGFGIVALEALACGTPVITIDTPSNGAKDLIEQDRNGSVVPLDPADLAKAIITWMAKDQHLSSEDLLNDNDWSYLAIKQESIYTGKL